MKFSTSFGAILFSVVIFHQNCVRTTPGGVKTSDEKGFGETKYSELLPGFLLMDAPNDIDRPGLIFRVTPQGERFNVGSLKVVADTGRIEIKNLDQTKDVKLGLIANFINLDSSNISANSNGSLNRIVKLKIKLHDNIKESLSDNAVDGELADALKTIKKNRIEFNRLKDRYFLIRETVSTKKMEYSFDKDLIAALGLNVSAQEKLKINPSASWNNSKDFQLSFNYERPIKVFYKIEHIVILSSATGKESLTLEPVVTMPYTKR